MAAEPTNAEQAAILDLSDERVPQPLYWNIAQVADWIEELGFPQYKPCFTTNLIDGKKLFRIEASHFPSIGITDFEHIKIIAKSIRDLMMVEEPDWNRSISLTPRTNLGMYLERKSIRGATTDDLTYSKFLLQVEGAKWRPPLANHCAIITNKP